MDPRSYCNTPIITICLHSILTVMQSRSSILFILRTWVIVCEANSKPPSGMENKGNSVAKDVMLKYPTRQGFHKIAGRYGRQARHNVIYEEGRAVELPLVYVRNGRSEY